MIPRFSIQLFSQTVHNPAVSYLAQALFDRLPDTDIFYVAEWGRSQSPPRQFLSILDEHSHLMICVGSPSFWGDMIGLEDLERWVSMGKTVLWLHIPPPDNGDEPTPPLNGMEMLPHEVWTRIDPVIKRIVALADVTRIQRRLSQKRHDYNPYGFDPRVRQDKCLDKKLDSRVLTDPLALEWQHRHSGLWNEAREADEKRWSDLEHTARSEEAVSVSAKNESRPESPSGPQETVAFKGQEADSAPIAGEPVQERAPATDSVSCAVYAASQWEGGTTELVQIWIHGREQADLVDEEARLTDELANRLRSQALGADLARGDRLSFALRMSVPTEMEPPVAAVTWRGEAVSVSFAVETSPVETKTRATGTLEIRLNHSVVPIGVVHFRVEIVPPGARTENGVRPLGENARPTDLVFVSYARADRAEVLRRVQGLKALGIRFFQDILSLSPGQQWDEEVFRQIDQSDVFLLCWSTAARDSEWVRKEYLHAQETSTGRPGSRPHITILPLEGPPPPQPPPELRHLHFSDHLLYALKVEGELAAEKGAVKS